MQPSDKSALPLLGSTLAERRDKEEIKKLRLERRKLAQELSDLRRPYWQRLVSAPEFITALITTVGAVFTVLMLLSNNYFDMREKLNKFQEEETKNLQRDADAKIKAANDSVDAAKKHADEETVRVREESEQKLGLAQAAADKREQQIRSRERSVELSYSIQDEIGAAIQRTAETTAQGSDSGFYKDAKELVSSQSEEFRSLRSSAERLWATNHTPEAWDAVMSTLSVPDGTITAFAIPFEGMQRAASKWWFLTGRSTFITGQSDGLHVWYPTDPDPAKLAAADSEVINGRHKASPNVLDVLAFSPDQGTIMTSEQVITRGSPVPNPTFLQAWDLKVRPPKFLGEYEESRAIQFVSSISNDRRIAVFERWTGNDAFIVDPTGFRQPIHLTAHKAVPSETDGETKNCIVSRVDDLSFSPTQPFLASSWTDDAIQVYNTESGKTIATVNAHGCANNAGSAHLQFSADGRRLLEAAESSGSALVWDTSDWHSVCRIPPDHGARGTMTVTDAKLSPELGSHLLIARFGSSYSGNYGPWKIALWDVDKCKELHSLYLGGQRVESDFSPNGKRVFVYLEQSGTKIFDLAGKDIADLKPYCGSPKIAITSSGKYGVANTRCGLLVYKIVTREDADALDR